MHKLTIKEKDINKQAKLKMDYGLVIGYKERSKEFILRPIGEAPLQTYIDDTFSAIAHMTNHYLTLFDSLETPPTPEAMAQIREKTYTRVVQTFSLMIDSVFPEMLEKEVKTDELMKINDKLLETPSKLQEVKDLLADSNK